MLIADYIYNFIHDYLFNADCFNNGMKWEIGTQTIDLAQWLSTATTIVLMILLVFLLGRFVLWLTKLVGGLFKW